MAFMAVPKTNGKDGNTFSYFFILLLFVDVVQIFYCSFFFLLLPMTPAAAVGPVTAPKTDNPMLGSGGAMETALAAYAARMPKDEEDEMEFGWLSGYGFTFELLGGFNRCYFRQLNTA